jgi:hypothetical protein
MASDAQTAVNKAWMDYWNGKGERPPEGTFFTGSDQYAPEAPDVQTRQAALDFFAPGTVKVASTTPLLNVPQVTPENYSAVSAANGGLTTVTAGQTIAIPANASVYQGHGVTTNYAPVNTASTNGLNALAGKMGKESGASSVVKGGLGTDKVAKTGQTPFQQDIQPITDVAKRMAGDVKFGIGIGSGVANIGAGIVNSEINAGVGIANAITNAAGSLGFGARNAASKYFTGEGLSKTGKTIDTGFQFVNPQQQVVPVPYVPPPSFAGVKNQDETGPTPPQPIQTTDEYMAKNFSKADISTVYDLRARALTGQELPNSIPLTLATSAWGTEGIYDRLNSTWDGGSWVIQGQFLVWKPDTTPTPTTAGNGSYYNGIGSGNYVPSTGGGSGGGGGGGGGSGGIASTIVSMRLSTG